MVKTAADLVYVPADAVTESITLLTSFVYLMNISSIYAPLI